jgi:hypothetical protein
MSGNRRIIIKAYQQIRYTIDEVVNPTLQINRAIFGGHDLKTIGQHPVSHPWTSVHSITKLLLGSIMMMPGN